MIVSISACGSRAPDSTGGSTGTSTQSSTGTDSASTIGSATSSASKREKGVKFAECMRGNGVSDFPDPNANGEFIYGVSVTPAVFTKAVDACKALQPPGSLSGQRSPKQQSLALKFAECVRSNGVPDFPDPVNGQPLIDTTKIPSSNLPGGMSILNAATHKCGGLLQLAARGGGGTGG
ncbi:MAG: hypothetical protein ACTHMY_00180 [Solirubrobacteraceae bacterium]